MPDEKLAAIRAQLPALARGVYLNNGTTGPLPVPAAEAMQAALARELGQGRVDPMYFPEVFATVRELRAALADLLGATPGEIALTANTTEGMNLALLSLRWRPGDEVITATTEHPGGLFPVHVLRRRYGVTVRMADLTTPGPDPVEAVRRLITPRTRLIAVSHVAWGTGELYPIADLAELAHRHGALLAVDGAQGAGAVPVDLRSAGVDFYAFPGQKWLLGPEGTGGLYVRADVQAELLPVFAGYFTAQAHNAHDFLPHPDARRFEWGGRHPVALAGLLAAVRWLSREVGPGWAAARIQALAARLRQRLGEVPGVRVVTPDRHAGLVTVQVEGMEPEAAARELLRRGFWIRSVPTPPGVRISCGFYNTEEEIDRIAGALADLARKT
ncbi:aminotransferase class V-fold PLP-dependent enzyme [Caldinitratiruptor microaerophilus]|uniref:Cysteine lyase n=1 Tax=Caldinitratiruptor microaerophilus TaxID=671077 RepID=A0AA35CK78_9FIRM|nr:aminotransferase class V-fold PLP-dependent enzyme [Caldinitratiruptor microaerophilus]BDG60737.1 cysteine lyase [Caldinitratiruptor microaerophilus]